MAVSVEDGISVPPRSTTSLLGGHASSAKESTPIQSENAAMEAVQHATTALYQLRGEGKRLAQELEPLVIVGGDLMQLKSKLAGAEAELQRRQWETTRSEESMALRYQSKLENSLEQVFSLREQLASTKMELRREKERTKEIESKVSTIRETSSKRQRELASSVAEARRKQKVATEMLTKTQMQAKQHVTYVLRGLEGEMREMQSKLQRAELKLKDTQSALEAAQKEKQQLQEQVQTLREQVAEDTTQDGWDAVADPSVAELKEQLTTSHNLCAALELRLRAYELAHREGGVCAGLQRRLDQSLRERQEDLQGAERRHQLMEQALGASEAMVDALKKEITQPVAKQDAKVQTEAVEMLHKGTETVEWKKQVEEQELSTPKKEQSDEEEWRWMFLQSQELTESMHAQHARDALMRTQEQSQRSLVALQEQIALATKRLEEAQRIRQHAEEQEKHLKESTRQEEEQDRKRLYAIQEEIQKEEKEAQVLHRRCELLEEAKWAMQDRLDLLTSTADARRMANHADNERMRLILETTPATPVTTPPQSPSHTEVLPESPQSPPQLVSVHRKIAHQQNLRKDIAEQNALYEQQLKRLARLYVEHKGAVVGASPFDQRVREERERMELEKRIEVLEAEKQVIQGKALVDALSNIAATPSVATIETSSPGSPSTLEIRQRTRAVLERVRRKHTPPSHTPTHVAESPLTRAVSKKSLLLTKRG